MKEVNGGWWVPHDDEYFGKLLPPDTNYKANGFQREHLLKAFEFVTRWNYAVDVGAHVGFWAKDMAEVFKNVYCFEPSPASFACLVKNMAGYNNVVMSPIALGRRNGTCRIARDDKRAQNSGSEYIIPADGDIMIQPLDGLKIGGCDLLKIDVEGYEYAVLQGAAGVIEKYKPVVIMECDKKFAKTRFNIPDEKASHFLRTNLKYREVARMRPDRIFVPI